GLNPAARPQVCLSARKQQGSCMSATHSHETTHAHPELSFVRKYIFSEDHKIIGIQFLFSTLIFLGIGGMLALFVRMQLGWPHGELPIFRNVFQSDNGGRM